MLTEFDLENWERKHLYHFFKGYDDPFFNITGNLEVTDLYHSCKANGTSFFLSSLFYCLKVANLTPNFRLRELDGRLVMYDVVHCGTTILYDDNTFGFAYFDYEDNLSNFIETGAEILKEYKENRSFKPRDNDINMIHFSIIPWVSFTSFKHARRFGTTDTIPKIVMGKLFDNGSKKMLPLSVEVHHALMDGVHVGQYFQLLQDMVQHSGKASG